MNLRSFAACAVAGALSIAAGCGGGSTSKTLPPPTNTTSGGAGGASICSVAPAPLGTCALAKGLTGWWRGENDATDSDGTAEGVWTGSQRYAPGEICQGFALDGQSFVRAPFTQTGPLTIDFWAESSATAEGTFDAAFATGDAAMAPYFQIDSDGTGNYRLFAQTEIPIGPIAKNIFQHMAVTYDGTTVVVYLDGKAVGNADWTHNKPLEFAVLKIGNNRDGQRFFQGIVDEVHVWDRALSASEVASLSQIMGTTLCP